jgi:PAS domain-containing protein
MRLNARRFESLDSRPDLILLAIEDITERKHAEEAAQDSRVRYRRLFESLSGILVLDATTGRSLMPTHIEQVLGYAPSELSGKGYGRSGCFRY